MRNFERKFGKYAINNLPLMIILCYAVGYIIQFINYDFLNFLALDPYKIVHGQVWRIITWIILPPRSSNILLTLLLLFCVYSIAVSIERVIGTFQFNIFIFNGILLTVIGALILLGVMTLIYGPDAAAIIFNAYSAFISSYYIYMSLFVVFALSFPDARFLFMFFIPVKAKWMIIIYVVDFIYDFLIGNIFMRVAMVAALINFLIFWLMNRKSYNVYGASRFKRKMEFNRQAGSKAQNAGSSFGGSFSDTARSTRGQITRHKCAICGRTEVDSPQMQFRFCSKCEGNYEYCEEHLYTHTHVHMS